MRRLAVLLVALLAAGCDGALSARWHSTLDRDHPLVGRVWDVGAGRFADPDAALAAARQATFVLLGEQHDNPDHHRLQARVVAAVTTTRRRPPVVFEMIDEERQPALDAYLAGHPGDAAGLGPALDWAASGWPDWAYYQPIAEAALAADLPLRAGNISRTTTHAIGQQGLTALPASRRQALQLDEPLAPAVEAAMREELFESHCQLMRREAMAPLVAIQRARDAVMAGHMATADSGDGAVLIAGNGHVRADRGVPAVLRRLAPNRPVIAIAFVEVRAGAGRPADYAANFGTDRLPFDFVWFTPRANNTDHCAALMERMRRRGRSTE